MTFINIDNTAIRHTTSEGITQTVMSQIILFNKPFNVLCQFQDDGGRTTLKQFLPDYPGFYAAGRLDYDSEGLLLLTNDGGLQHRISDPKHKLPKTYWVQVEGIITEDALTQLRQGVELKDGKTQPALAKAISEPAIWERTPPIRERKNIPVSWIALTISEGKNRQVRRMTAAVGFPTLRLIRASIGEWSLECLLPGEHQLLQLTAEDLPTRSNTTTNKGKPQKSGYQKTKMPASSRHLK